MTPAAQSPACGLALFALIKVDKVGTVQTLYGPHDIVQIAVVGMHGPHGWNGGTPVLQYTLIPSEERGA